MGFGLGILRWAPDAFWRATPRELMAAADGLRGGPQLVPATRGDLVRLMCAFPDQGCHPGAPQASLGSMDTGGAR